MSITVRDLIKQPHLQLALLAGAKGLDREISWAHVSDLPNASEWMGQDEILLTNGTNIGASGAKQIAYLNRLEHSGASGLIVGLGTSDHKVTLQMARHADDLGFALLTVPYSVAFTSVVRCVAHANDREEARQLTTVIRLYDVIRRSLAENWPAPEMVDALARELNLELHLLDAITGLSLVPGREHSVFGKALVSAYAAHGNAIPGALHLDHEAEPAESRGAVAVAVPGASDVALVAESLNSGSPSSFILRHLATCGALMFAQLVAAWEQDRRRGSDLMRLLIDGRHDHASANGQLKRANIDLSTCAIAALRGDRSVTEASVHAELTRYRVPHVLARRDGVVYVLLPECAIMGTLASPQTHRTEAIGVANALTSLDRIAPAAREALWALGVTEAEGGTVGHYGALTSLVLPRTPTEAGVLVERVLGPLLDYDAAHATDYIHTLRAILRHDRSWQPAARDLHIHRQTLAYRLRRIEELTGRGTTATEHLAEWWFALRAYDLLTRTHGEVLTG